MFAEVDPYRATTHNKGIMNGIDAVVMATGNDWRAIEAGAHAYAARNGQYSSLTRWWQDEDGNLRGAIELPLAVGIVGGATRVHPTAQIALKIMKIQSARQLAGDHRGGGSGAKSRGDARAGDRRHPARPHANARATDRGRGRRAAELVARIVQQMIDEKNIRPERARAGNGYEEMHLRDELKLVPVQKDTGMTFTPNPLHDQSLLMRPAKPVGIVGYGAYVPRFRLPGSEVARVWTGGLGGSPVTEKAVAGPDEDVTTMSIEAARNALARSGIDPLALRAVWIGSESHPYAVKPTSTIVAESIGASPNIQAADWEFACKAGTEAVQASIGMVGSGMGAYTLSIGMDTAQARPGDALEYTAASGGAAFIIGAAEEACAVYQGSYSFVTDTPDFWRRAHENYPSHGERFTGEPAYFNHTTTAASRLMEMMGTTAADYTHTVFHQPNVKFPSRAAQMVGFKPEQIKIGPAGGRNRQRVFRLVHARPDGDPGCRQTRRPHPDDQLWQRRGFGCVRYAS